MRSIKTKLFISYAILVLLVTMIIGVISLKTGYDSIQKEAKNSLMLISSESAKLVENRMEALINTLDMISKKKEIQNMGWEVDIRTIKEELEKTKFIDIGFVLPNGYTYYTDGTVRLMSDRSYIKASLGGKAEISDVVISRVTRKPEIEVSVPVRKNGQIVGALVGRMEADSISEITMDIGYGENGFAFIVNQAGTIIAHPDEDKVLTGYNPVKEVKNNPELSSMANAFQNIIIGKSGVETYDDEKRSMYAGFAPIEGTGWSFIITADQKEVMSAIPKMMRTILTVSLIILGGSLVVVYLLDSSMIRPLLEITKHSKCVSDLDIRENISNDILKQKDEIGTLSGAFQVLTENLREIIMELIKSANRVSDTAMELTATSQQSALISEDMSQTVGEIAQGAYEQARNIESGLLQASLLNQKIEINHQHMINLNVTTGLVNEVVKIGLKDIDRLIYITNENDIATKNICDVILQMKQSSEQIGDTSRVISEISKQTNLLSLNAAIEAARAGEAGKGFSIVAEEIQRLADESAKSTKYIDGIVAGLQDKITKSVESMEQMSITSKEQHKSISDSIIKYQDISSAMKNSEEAVNELNNSEKDMETANNEIKCMLQSLSAIAEQNAAGTQQAVSTMEEQTATVQIIADVSERLNQLANDLRATVSKFKV